MKKEFILTKIVNGFIFCFIIYCVIFFSNNWEVIISLFTPYNKFITILISIFIIGIIIFVSYNVGKELFISKKLFYKKYSIHIENLIKFREKEIENFKLENENLIKFREKEIEKLKLENENIKKI